MVGDDFKAFLTTAGIAEGATGWAVRIGTMPPAPDRVIALTRSGAGEVSWKSTGGDEVTLQVRVRGGKTDGAVTEAKAEEIYRALDEQVGLIGANIYLWVKAMQTPTDMGREPETQRPEFVCNFRVGRKLT